MIQVKTFQIGCRILPFKPEILQKHLDYNKHRIQTARDKKLGEPGDMFYIYEAGLYMLSFVAAPINMEQYAAMYCDIEGFGTRGNGGYEELLKTLRTIYPDEKSVISHTLIKVNASIEMHPWKENEKIFSDTTEQCLVVIAEGVEKIARELEQLRKDDNEEIKEWEKL